MNLATPILICNESEDFRSLLREMLAKHGFFHVLEASSMDELLRLAQSEVKSHFLLLQGSLLEDPILQKLKSKKEYIVFTQPEDKKTLTLAANLGVKHLMSFPFSSSHLMQKIEDVIQ